MSNLPLKELKPAQAEKMDFSNFDITLKRDGTLIYFTDGKLYSPRCERSDRFKHILNILKENNSPNLFGEMYVENGNVFDVSSSENWVRAVFMPIDLISNEKYIERQKKLKELVSKINNSFITQLVKFKDFKEGWDYVIKTNGEGLVIRNERDWIKVKILKEVKEEIKEHEPSKDKGTFITITNNRISGTSKDFVAHFNQIKQQGKIPIAEIEFAFYTEEGKMFQPRLRKIYAKGEENE